MSVRFASALLFFTAACVFPSAPALSVPAPNGYLIVFTAGIDLTLGERGGIYVMRPDGSGMRQLTSFETDHFNYSGDGINLPDDHASFSPDGKKIIFTSSRDHVLGVVQVNSPDNFELYTMNVNGSGIRQLTSNDALDTEPVFSPDGSKIAFVSERAQKGNRDIWVMNADGTNPVRLTSDSDADMEPAWSPDGTKIAYTRVTFEGVLGAIGQQKDVWIMNADGSGKRQLTNQRNEDHDPTFSPDGTQLVITSELGKILHTEPFGDVVKLRISDAVITDVLTADATFGGGDPAWSPDGSKIVYFRADLPVITSPMEIHVMNADGSNKQRIDTPGLLDIHPNWGVAADSDNDGRLDYLENANFSFSQTATSGSAEQGDQFGAAVAYADLSHDGFQDVILGVPGERVLGVAGAGRIALVRGSALGPDFGALIVPTMNALLWGTLLQSNGHFGQTLASGDFNGDGFTDLAIGAPGQNAVFVARGETGPFQMLAGAGGFGSALAVGDFNDDGKKDLAIGAPSDLRPVGGTSVAAGSVRVFYGSASGLSAPQIIDQGNLAVGDAGAEEAGDQFGAALAAGDFNGDGVDDLAIGVPGEDIAGVTDAGLVHLIPGKAGSTLQTAAAVARDARSLESPYGGLQAGAFFGEALAVGDFNGDFFNVADLVVGIPHQNIGSVGDAGLVAVYDGLLSSAALVGTTGGGFSSEDAGGGALASNRFGQTLVVGNFGGDGVPDLAVAAPNMAVSGNSQAGQVFIIPGSRGTTTVSLCSLCVPVLVSPIITNSGGLSVAAAQRITGDQIGSPAASGERLGSSLLLPSGSTLAATDLDKDGQADLLIGVPQADRVGVVDAGVVGIRYGVKVGTFTLSPDDAIREFGDSIAYQVTWTHPENWHDLETIHLRVANDDGVVAWVRFDEASNTLSLLDPATRQFSRGGMPGNQVEIATAAVSLDLAQSHVTGSGALGRSVTIDFPLRFLPALQQKVRTGEFRVELMATDDHGNSQGFDEAGTLLLSGAPDEDGCGIASKGSRTSPPVWLLLLALVLLLCRANARSSG